MSTSKEELPTHQGTAEPLLNPTAQRKRRNDFMLGFLASFIIFLVLIVVGVAAFMLSGANNQTDQFINCATISPVEGMTTTVSTTVTTATKASIDREMEEMGKSMEQAFSIMGMMIKGLQGLAVGDKLAKINDKNLQKPEMEHSDNDSDWVTVNRTETGQKFLHRFFPEKLTYEEAEKKCQEHGAHLSGFTGQSELDVLDKMLDEAISKGIRYDGSDNVWIGARRRDACSTREGLEVEKGGFNPDPTHPCSRSRVFEWVNGVAQNPPDFQNLWITDFEPSFAGDSESCVVLMKGAKNIPGWPRNVLGDKKLNDVPCELEYYFFCGKEAPIVKTDE